MGESDIHALPFGFPLADYSDNSFLAVCLVLIEKE